ncbi:hypothetical protein ABEB36_000537 [Hypothenemus hampei]|uniref:Uncharacterized protein n=1 Tax=Hypothenemus hampei TaxID=57062 RepID=A0ABD1FE72_HYPHA
MEESPQEVKINGENDENAPETCKSPSGSFEIENCRLCDNFSEKMFNIFEDNPEGYQLIGLIKENLPIVLYKTDPLSKRICEKCVENLQIISSLKKTSRKTQEKYVEKLKNEADTTDKNILLFLGCTGNKLIDNGEDDEEEEEELKDEATSTDDLTILCANCKTSILDASTVNGDIELASELHEAIQSSLKRNREQTEDEEMSNSEDAEMVSELESDESQEEQISKRRRIDKSSIEIQEEIDKELSKRGLVKGSSEESSDQSNVESDNEENNEDLIKEQERVELIKSKCEELFKEEPTFTYEPLSLLQATLNCINTQNVPEYEALPYNKVSTACRCKICDQDFQNIKLLALHETDHINVEMDKRIDNPKPWPDDHPHAEVRNKWLTLFDETVCEEDTIDDIDDNNEHSIVDESKDVELLLDRSVTVSKKDEIVLVNMKPMVNGIYLGDYTKEERKAFYQCMRIGGQTKRFCPLCRFCFKDNWAIESHYFSFACHYTCKYCGMRFNKQRHRFDEHIKMHRKRKDSISEKIFTASKVNNTMPKVIQPDKVKRVNPGEPEKPREIRLEDYSSPPVITKGGYDRNRLPNSAPQTPQHFVSVKIKEEPKDSNVTSPQNKTQNQAYFCRKCYKVFFKLDEFNAHSRNCDYNNYTPSPNRAISNGTPKGSTQIKIKQEPGLEKRTNGEVFSSTGRPVRNCVRDIGPYKDEVYIPKQILNETVAGPPQSFICHICGTPFPTIYSRNSHMRIHKGETQGSPNSGGSGHQMMVQHNILKQRLQQQQQHNYQMQKAAIQQQQIHNQHKQMMRQKQLQQRAQQQNNYPQYEDIRIKEEPVDSFEPMVEIHEGHERSPSPPQNFPTTSVPRELGGGEVSLTPIVKKPQLNPNILKLVQNNPNISLVTKKGVEKSPSNQRSNGEAYRTQGGNIIKNAGGYQGPYAPTNQPNRDSNSQTGFVMMSSNLSPADDNRSYKCSSCWEAFSNKSHLYFHKKNQCEGSRFPCPFCKKRFGTEAAYSSHIFYSHPE